MDIESIRKQIKANCNISDARYWGFYSICGLLLRMRDLYRSEKGIPFYESIPMEDISPWIEQRDKLWNQIYEKAYDDIEIDGSSFKPFDIDGVNDAVSERGMFYGAGYGRFFKPNFFLAASIDTRRTEGYTIYIAGEEYERDIETVPAMLQGNDIVIRKDRVKALVWERFYELRSRKYEGTLDYVFSAFNVSRTEAPSRGLDKKIDRIVDEILDIFLLHEIGEAIEDREAVGWMQIVHALGSTQEELKLRAIKDVLADCSDKGPLQHIISSQSNRLLGFYIIMLTGLHKIVFPEIANAFQQFVDKQEWSLIEEARQVGYQRERSRRDALLGIWKKTGDPEEIKKFLDAIH